MALTIAVGTSAGLSTVQATEVRADTSALSAVTSFEQSYVPAAPRNLSTLLGLTGRTLTNTWLSSPNVVWPSTNGSIGLSIGVQNNRNLASNFQWRIERQNANGSWSTVWTSANISVAANANVTLNPALRGVTGNANYRVGVRGNSGNVNTFTINWGTVPFR